MVLLTLLVQMAVWLFGQHPITAMPQNEAGDTSGACAPRDCVYSEWTLWSDCTEECGEDGVRQRVRHMLSDDGCGGTCNGTLAESEPCNVRCCPTNCVYSEWNAWLYCRCSEDVCDQVGWFIHHRDNSVRPATTAVFVFPPSKQKPFGQRFFSYAGPVIWNKLPYDIRSSQSKTSFKQALKTHLFSTHY